MKGANVEGSIFRAKSPGEAATPRALADKSQSESSTPNQISDESGETESASEESGLGDSLSIIANVLSSENDDGSTEHVEDGRWNIPFDGSFDEDLVGKSPNKGMGHETELKQIGFVSICKGGHRRQSSGTEVTPLRPVARRIHGDSSPFTRAVRRGLSTEKENISPKKGGSVRIALRSIR